MTDKPTLPPDSIFNIHELIDWTPPETKYVIEKGILPEECRLMIYGAGKVWKTNTTMDLGWHIASGLPWLGFKTFPHTVLIEQLELPTALYRERGMKYASGLRYALGDNTKVAYPSNLFFKSINYLKLDTSFGLKAIESDVIRVSQRIPDKPIVLIIDPLFKVMAGKLSDEYDVRKFEDNIDLLRGKTHVSVIIIHHRRKTKTNQQSGIEDFGAEEALGSSYFGNWIDTMIRLELLDPFAAKVKVKLSFDYARHATDLLPSIKFKWSRKNLQPTLISTEYEQEEEESTVREIE